jgi:pimeloyl-ACP methyl ester carboxylesterase
VGVSAGGPSALQFALRFPMRTKALVLVVPAAYAPPPNPVNATLGSRPMRVLLDTALRSDFLYWAAGKVADGAFMSAVLGTPRELLAKAPAQERARLRAFVEHVLPVSARRLGLRNDARIVLSLARYDLEAIAAPTLAISAADDLYGTFEGARYTAQHVPDGHFIGYPSGGHMLVGRNAAVAAAIDAFLRARDPGRLARPAP